MGRKGGKSRSPAKLAAIKKNAQKAGRPRKPLSELSRSGLWRRKQRARARATQGIKHGTTISSKDYPTGGTFRLSIGSQQSSELPFDCSEKKLKRAVNKLALAMRADRKKKRR